MEDQSYILALDIGTSSVRALLYAANGTPVPGIRARQAYALAVSREGEASVDADFLVERVACVIDEVLLKAGERAGRIAAVATSTFWHTLLPLDASDRPLLPLLTWEDTRPWRAATELRSRLDENTVHRRTGARLHTSYWPAKLTWLAGAYPEIAQRAACFVSFGEYLHRRLLGRSVCSLSMASGTGLLNLRTRTWDTDLLAFLHVAPERLPEVGDLPDSLQGLTPEFATRWPALKAIPWFPPIGDGAAANLGSNCSGISTWAVTIGTSSAMRVIVPPELITPEGGLWLYALDKRRALLGSALSEGGNLLAWLRQTLQLSELDELDQQLARLEPAAHGLTILPMLAGERGPGWHSAARLTISGLSSRTTPAEIALACLEALVFQLSSIYDQLIAALSDEVTQPRLIASGTALLSSSTLSHILADTLNRPLELMEIGEASARGAALLALEALGLLPDLTRLAPRPARVIPPNPARHALYAQARERQQALYNLLLG